MWQLHSIGGQWWGQCEDRRSSYWSHRDDAIEVNWQKKLQGKQQSISLSKWRSHNNFLAYPVSTKGSPNSTCPNLSSWESWELTQKPCLVPQFFGEVGKQFTRLSRLHGMATIWLSHDYHMVITWFIKIHGMKYHEKPNAYVHLDKRVTNQ